MPKRKWNYQMNYPDQNPIHSCNTNNLPNNDNNNIIKKEPSEKSYNNYEDYSATGDSIQSDVSNCEIKNFEIIKNQINLLGSRDNNQNTDILAAIMTKLNSMDDKINEIKFEISALKRIIVSNNVIPTNDNSPVENDFQFDKLQSVEEIKDFAKNLEDKEFYSKMITICSKLGGNDEYDCTYRILKFLTRKDILGCMNKTGTFNKAKFPIVMSEFIYDSILINMDCTFLEIEKSVGRVLHNCIPDAKRSLLK